jgi:hypothetical protein
MSIFSGITPISLIIGLIVCIIITLIAKYFFDKRNEESEENKIEYIWLYSILIGVLVGSLTILIYRQYSIHKSKSELLDEDF